MNKLFKLLTLLLAVVLLNPVAYARTKSKTAIRREAVMPEEKTGVGVELESSYGMLQLAREDYRSEYTITTLKPVLSFDTEMMKFVGFVPLTWININETGYTSSYKEEDSSVRIAGRPDLSAHVKLLDERMTLGGGTKLPMFSVSRDSADLYRTWQFYTQARLKQPIGNSISLLGDAKIEKDLDKTVDSEGWSFTLRRGYMFRGEFGAETALTESVALGSSLNGIYNLSDTSVTFGSRGRSQKSNLGGSRYVGLNLFSDFKLDPSAKVRANLSKAVISSKNEDGSSLAISSIDELNQVSDFAATIQLMGSF